MKKIRDIIKRFFPTHRETPIYEDIQQILEEPNDVDDKITSLKCKFGVDIPVVLLSFLMEQIYVYDEARKETPYMQQLSISLIEQTNMSKRKKSREIRRIHGETEHLIHQRMLQKEIYQRASRLFMKSRRKTNYADEIMVDQFNNFIYHLQEVFPNKDKCLALLYQNKSFCQHQKNFEDMAHYFLQQMVLEYTCLVGIVRYKSDLVKDMPDPPYQYQHITSIYRILLYTYVLLYGYDEHNMQKIYERMNDEGVKDFYVSAHDIEKMFGGWYGGRGVERICN